MTPAQPDAMTAMASNPGTRRGICTYNVGLGVQLQPRSRIGAMAVAMLSLRPEFEAQSSVTASVGG